MNIKYAILAAISSEAGGELRGRTLLQKKLYFLSVLAKEDFGFGPHYYGPYSQAVADELGALVDAGFVEEEKEIFSDSPWDLPERRRYRYHLTDASREVLKEGAAGFGQYYHALKKINSHSVSSDIHLISMAAKVHIIIAERHRASINQIRERATELGWELDENDIGKVVQYLQHLGLGRRA